VPSVLEELELVVGDNTLAVAMGERGPADQVPPLAPPTRRSPGWLTITGRPVDCYDGLLQGTELPDVAADCARVKEDLRSLCRAAHRYEQRHKVDASLGEFLQETGAWKPADVLTADEDNA
jgi:hypothetical protein